MASVIAGTLAIPAVFAILFFVLRRGGAENPLLPSLLAGLAVAISINQIELSQRLYAYGATTLFSALLVLAHLMVVDCLNKPAGRLPGFSMSMLFYAAAGGLALSVNPGLMLAVLVSGLMLACLIVKEMRRRWAGEGWEIFATASLAFLVLFFSALLNLKNPKYGYRYYMEPYYYRLDWGIPWFLLSHAYDLLTYHLNLFYDSALYWPLRLNPALLPLVILCVVGWTTAALGHFGRLPRHLAALSFFAVCIPALLSIARIYTFGGDRRSLFLSPFLFAFAGLGLYRALRIKWLGPVVALTGAAYLFFWAAGLPAFYRERRTAVDGQQLAQLWRENGQPPIQVAGGGANAVRYALRQYPEIKVLDMPYTLPDVPYLYVSLHWPIEADQWDVKQGAKLKEKGYTATLLAKGPVKYLESWDYPTSLYFPPNGFWVYKVTKAGD